MKAANEFIAEMAEQISMPDVYQEIRHQIENQDVSINDFVKIIESDSMLSIRLMRIAHSPYFGFPRRAENLKQALNLMGIMQLHDLVLNSLSLRTLTSVPQQVFNLQEFWTYSVQCGIAARTLAQYGMVFPINPYFTLGLLHEIGHAAMYSKLPELSLQAFEESQQGNTSLVEKEVEILGFDYTQVGTALMQLWQLPELHQQVTAFHLTPEKAKRDHRQAVQIIHLAHMICQDLESGSNHELIENIKQNDVQLQKLPSNINDIIKKEIKANTDSVLAMLWPDYAALTTPINNELLIDE